MKGLVRLLPLDRTAYQPCFFYWLWVQIKSFYRGALGRECGERKHAIGILFFQCVCGGDETVPFRCGLPLSMGRAVSRFGCALDPNYWRPSLHCTLSGGGGCADSKYAIIILFLQFIWGGNEIIPSLHLAVRRKRGTLF
jgi:hypothetical protein